MARLADPGRFQAMVWMHIDAAMQLYAVLRPGGDGISADVALLARIMKNHQFRVGVRRYPLREVGGFCVTQVSSRPWYKCILMLQCSCMPF
jgi:hypothetical protein